MATRKDAHDAAKKKAAKEKKLLVLLSVFLLLALGYAYKTLTHLHNSGGTPVAVSSGSTAPGSTTAAPSASASAGSGAPADVPSGGPAAAPPSTKLVPAVKPAPDQGQLESFTLFAGKDPFNSDGPSTTAGTTTPTPTPPAPTKKKSSPSGSQAPAAKLASAVISVNGARSLVSVQSVFPQSTDPSGNGIFRLVGLTKTTAKVGIVGGSYANGASTLTLHVGRTVTLANTTDGKRYKLELFPQGTS